MNSSARRTDSFFPLNRVSTALLLSVVYCTSAHAGGTAFDATSISAMGNASAGQAAEAGDASVLFAKLSLSSWPQPRLWKPHTT